MPLGTALASGLQTYTAIRDEQRRSKLHDLQVQNFELRNAGMRSDNQFRDDTFDYRVQQQRANTEQATATARIQQEKLDFLEWSRPHLEDQTASATSRARSQAVGAAHDARRAGANANIAERNDWISSQTFQGEAAATNAKNLGVVEDEAVKRGQRLRAAARDHLSPVIQSVHTVDELFHSRRFQGVSVGMAEELYGPAIAASYGAHAQVVGFQPTPDGQHVIPVIDTNNDGVGNEDAVEEAIPMDFFLAEVLGEEEGPATFQRLMQGQTVLNDRRGQNKEQARRERERLEVLSGAQAQYDDWEDAIPHLHGQLAEIQQARASLARPAWASIDPVTGARSGPSQGELKTQQAELDQREAQVLEAAEVLGVPEAYLRNPALYEQQRERQGQNQQRLSQFVQRYDSGELDAVDSHRVRTSLAQGLHPRDELGMPQRLNHREQAERIQEVTEGTLSRLDQDLKGLLTRVDRDSGRSQLDNGRLAEIRMDLRNLTTMHRDELMSRLVMPHGEQEVEMILSESARQAVRNNVPVEAAFTALLGENADRAEEMLAFRAKLEQGGLLRNQPGLRGLAPDELAGLFDHAQQQYGDLIGSGTSAQAAERAVLSWMAAQVQ